MGQLRCWLSFSWLGEGTAIDDEIETVQKRWLIISSKWTLDCPSAKSNHCHCGGGEHTLCCRNFQRIDADGLPIDFTPQAIFDDGPQIERLKQIEQTFGREDNDYLVLLRGSLSTSKAKATLSEPYKALSKADNIKQVDSLVSAVTPVGELVNRGINLWEEENVFERAKSIPEFQRALISEDGDTIVIRVRIDSSQKVSEISPVIDRFNPIVEANAPPADVECLYHRGALHSR